MTQFTPTSTGARISDAAEGVIDASIDALDTGRQFVGDAVGKIGETTRELRGSAADLARASAGSVRDASVAAQRQLARQAGATRRYVTSQPWKSVAIAAVAGAAATAVAIALLRKPRGRE